LSSQDSTSGRPQTFIGRHPVTAYFALTFAVSWFAALAVAALHFKQREPLPKMTGILMFPAMLLGPSLVGIALTERLDGRRGLRALLARMLLARLPAGWYAALLIAPVLVLIVLFGFKAFVSPAYAPNRFLVGVLFGVPAGFLEEIGWTGYAFRKMRSQYDALPASILLGLLWSMWHLPVIDYLGTATPHAGYWFPFFLAFTVAMTAMRVLISWIYTNTDSVLLAQLMHVSSTASLVIFSPPRVTAEQEAMWYALYGASLWLIVAVIAKTYGIGLTRQST
jgi:uncharacterized protein